MAVAHLALVLSRPHSAQMKPVNASGYPFGAPASPAESHWRPAAAAAPAPAAMQSGALAL